MFDNNRSAGNLEFPALLIAVGIVICMAGNSASAVTAEVAKRCNALTAQAFPPREPGNPALGSAKGTPQSHQDYFKKCIANGGRMTDGEAKDAK